MVRLKVWQWVILAVPIAAVLLFMLIAAGVQIQAWGINWIWAMIGLVLLGWRLLLVRWTRPALSQVMAIVQEVADELEAQPLGEPLTTDETGSRLEAAIQATLEASRTDPPLWEDWLLFWKRCQTLVEGIAHVYYPDVKHPLLNIYVPQAYALIRGTVDDMDQWMQKLSPALNQVTIGQAYQAYQVYLQLQPSARKLWQIWNWAQWLLNPAAAVARQATQRYSDQANQQLLLNLNQLLREVALVNLSRQAIALYGGQVPALETISATKTIATKAETKTLREILAQAEPTEIVEQKPVNILLVGRTGAGKSSLINTLFVDRRAEVDVLPSTNQIQAYHWQANSGESLTLWDTPGYEQVDREDLRQQVLDYLPQSDLLLLATPALDPALQMDVDFLKAANQRVPDLPTITILTQVDRLRPLREWQPPYDWKWGERPKEIAIRQATAYRSELLGEDCNLVLPVVTGDVLQGRVAWGMEDLSLALVEAIAPAKQLRLSRFLRNLEARTIAAAKIIDHYTFLMTTTQGVASLLKSPILRFISTLMTGSPTLAYLLAEQIPIEQLPLVIGKLQMAYDLFNLLSADQPDGRNFDLIALWPLLLDNSTPPDRNAWAFGHTLTEYWTKTFSSSQLQQRFQDYLQQQKGS
ncbi:MAG TPA: GTPase family protein [Coleofasciculaceae cyanobacterium]